MRGKKIKDGATAEKKLATASGRKPRKASGSARLQVVGNVIELTQIEVPAPPVRTFDFYWDNFYHRLLWRLSGHRVQQVTFLRVLSRDKAFVHDFLVDSALENINVRSRVCLTYLLDEDNHPHVLCIENLRTRKTWSLPRAKRAKFGSR
jgi:hypothetical protein